MGWAFKPVDDNCGVCEPTHPIDIHRERHYVVWMDDYDNGEGKPKGAYRRICAKAYDEAKQRPYNRRSTDDDLMQVPEIVPINEHGDGS